MAEKDQTASDEQVHPRRYQKMVVLSLFLFIMLILDGSFLPFLGGIVSASLQQQKSRRLFAATVSASGLLQSSVYNLTFQSSDGGGNIISEIAVTQGEHVRQGQVLARLDPTLLQRNVDAAHAAVVAAQNRLAANLARQQRSIQWLQALVAEAEASYHAAKTTLSTTNLQAQASIAEAQTTLTSDKHALVTVQQQAKTQMQAAQVQLKQSIASCKTSSQDEKPTPASHNQSHHATTRRDTVKVCKDLARAEYDQVVAAAQTSIATAQEQLIKDQAAIAQASVSARAAVTAAQGQVAVAWAHILVAAYEPGPLDAAKDVAEARENLTAATEQLHTAQLNLTTDTILIAPHDGTVTAINGTVGGPPAIHTNIAPQAIGSADTGVFIQLVDLAHVNRLLLNVNEADIMRVKVGQHVQFTLKAYADRQFSGTVSAISPNGVMVDNVMKYSVIVSIEPESMKGVTFFPNMTATATIAVS
jgi:multidrug efflux pump subunit AcrA (membrane-fusion protein)